jgi:predicted phosphodiesterase
VLSDVHLKTPGDEDTLVAAFTYFRDNGADGVIIAGDIADTGRISELKRCVDAFNLVFPGGKRPDGGKVEKLFVYGNHDLWGCHWSKKHNPEDARRDGIGWDEKSPARVWEEVVGEPYSDFWIKNIKGFTFVGAHWTRSDQFDGLGDFLKAHAKEIDPSKPFFYTQHAHPKDTCIGPWAWGRDNGASTNALSLYPNAVAFSGHSHYPLTDERSVWQGAFTSINTASLRYCSHDYSLRENIGGNGHGFRNENRKHLMDKLETGDSRHGMLVSVYGNSLVIERRDFVSGMSLGDDWVISVPCREDMSFAARAAERSAPQFAADAKLSVTREGNLLKLSFPRAKPVKKCRVFEYEVTATLLEDDVDLVQVQRRVFDPLFYKAEGASDISASCVLSLAEIPIKGNTVFSVRPMDCFGLKGKALTSVFNTSQAKKA